MKQIIKQIQNFYDSLDKMIIFGVLVILFALTFIFNFMWAMPKTFMFLVGVLVGKILFGTSFVADALSLDDSHDKSSNKKSKEPDNTVHRSATGHNLEYNDFGQPISTRDRGTSLES